MYYIQEIEPNLLANDARLLAYSNRFREVKTETLSTADDISQHFSIFDGSILVGGFRVTQIGSNRTEIERIFPNILYANNSFELGRFWIDKKLQGQKIGRSVTEATFTFVQSRFDDIYFKTSKELGMIAETFGGINLDQSSFNHLLGYECQVYRLTNVGNNKAKNFG